MQLSICEYNLFILQERISCYEEGDFSLKLENMGCVGPCCWSRIGLLITAFSKNGMNKKDI